MSALLAMTMVGKHMDQNGDLADAADSRGELPGELPGEIRGEIRKEKDEFDSLVLDDAFIAAGVPEASLPQYQPRPGSAPPSRSDRSAAPPPRVLGGFTGWSPEGARRRQMRATGFLLGAAFLLFAGVVLTGFLRLGPSQGLRGAAAASAQLPPATEFAAAVPGTTRHVAGLTAAPVGTCFDVRDEKSSATVSATPCAQQHEYELIARDRAPGQNQQYPAPSYWDGVVVDRCAQQLVKYIGWVGFPAGVTAGSFNPTAAGWATGDRAVYCVAVSVPSTTGSLLGRAAPTQSPTA